MSSTATLINQTESKPLYGQIVIGPPGSGKSTYCNAMKQFLTGIGRKTAIINLDPANENMPFEADWDVSELITVPDVMKHLSLGPNGGLLYCLEFLEKNFVQMKVKLKDFQRNGVYVLFDCPGQVELYTHHNSVKNIVEKMARMDARLVAVHLVDSHYCNEAAKFVSVLLTSLSTMLQIALPHVNVLSKMDLIEKYGKLAFDLNYFTEVLDLSYLLDDLRKDPFLKKFAKLNEALIGVIEDYSLVSFTTLHVENKKSMANLIKTIDRANGYVQDGVSEIGDDVMEMMSEAVGTNLSFKEAELPSSYDTMNVMDEG